MVFKNEDHRVRVKSKDKLSVRTMQENNLDLPQKSWKKKNQNRAENYSDRDNLFRLAQQNSLF